MTVFCLFVVFIALQRMIELAIAKRNEVWLKKQGAVEFGQDHYRIIVFIHIAFFLVYIFEVTAFKKQLSGSWPLLFSAFLFTQAGRIWALASLGKYWNTKIIVLPEAKVVMKGPYRFIKHPNYVIVALEFLIIPLVFKAYITTILFTLLNAAILSIRIPAEEQALKQLTEYETRFVNFRRFFPKMLK